MTYLVDSDWLIDALTGKRQAREVLDRLGTHGMSLSILSFGELFDGFLGTPDPAYSRREFHVFVAGFEVLYLTEHIMTVFAERRVELRRIGKLIPDIDLLIGLCPYSSVKGCVAPGDGGGHRPPR